MTTKSPVIIEDDLIPDTYVLNNFNDLGAGMITLFELMVVNNWYLIASMYVDVT